jgi:hypothetical protein
MLSIFTEINQAQFDEGWQAWNKYAGSGWQVKPTNPYKIETPEWYSWNKGWNLNDKGLCKYNP